ncbi:MAG TPA: ATP-binding cassette domain-containing protein, partial [Pseudobdellovibrionaceae bacterium]|nr:ATP-binding cassette domain-containing protein [Pseudobdellovibrionaceae bacterium]
MSPTVKRLISEVRPYKKYVALVAFMGIANSLAYSQMALRVRDLQNTLQENRPLGDLQNVSLYILSLGFVVAVSRYFHLFTMKMIAEWVVNGLRTRLQAKFMNLSVGFHGDYAAGSGGLMSRILNDTKYILDGYQMLADFFREPLLAVFLIGNLFWLNWKLTLFVFVLLPFLLWFLRQVSRSIRKYVTLSQEQFEKITSTIKESLDGVRTIQSFNLAGWMAEKLRKQSDHYLEIRKKSQSRIEIMGPVNEFTAICAILFVFYYFGIEIQKGAQTPGDALAFLTSMLMMNVPLKKLQESYVKIQETVVAANRVYKMLDETGEIPEGKGHSFPENWSTITYRNVGFSYGGDVANLRGINLTIRRGEQIAFVGQSGSGKSTLVNLLTRTFDPTEGEILIDDIPLRDFDLTALRRHVAVVSQDVFLFSESIEENIHAGDLERGSSQVIDAAKSANAFDFISKMKQGFESRVGDRGNLLSGGEKQRISIARAIFKDAPILILDEATSALDSTSEREVQKGLDQLMAGRTSLVIAHRLSTIQNADRIIVMKNGEIVEEGKHEGLLAKDGHYLQFWKLQAK